MRIQGQLIIFFAGILILALPLDQASAQRSKRGPVGVAIDLSMGLTGSARFEERPESDGLEGQFGASLSYEHKWTRWLYAGPRLEWAVARSEREDNEYSSLRVGAVVVPTWRTKRTLHLFAIGGGGASHVSRDGNYTGWGYNLLGGVGAKLPLRGMHLRFSLIYCLEQVDALEAESEFGRAATFSDTRLSRAMLAMGAIF